MYDAFEKILMEFPAELIEHLIIGGQGHDFTIQPLIFQKFADIMENKLPVSVFSRGKHIEFYNMC
jgi:hypothetical protein